MDEAEGRGPLLSEKLTEEVIGAAIEVHRTLGPGLLESAYEACLAYEFTRRGLRFRRQVDLPVVYGDVRVDCGYRLDFVVADTVVVELKAIDKLTSVHDAQLLTYLRLSGLAVGLLINFKLTQLKHGIVRRVDSKAMLRELRDLRGQTGAPA